MNDSAFNLVKAVVRKRRTMLEKNFYREIEWREKMNKLKLNPDIKFPLPIYK